MRLHWLDGAAVHAALPYDRLADALADAFAEGLRAPPRHHHEVPRPGREPAVLLLMPAWRPGHETGVKLVHVAPGNEALGLPVVQGLYLLFDGPTGTPRAVLDGTALTLRRTAAISALAARHLARPDSHTLAVFGAGALAPHLARAHAAVRPLRHCLVWNRSRPRAERLARALAADFASVRVVEDRHTALAEADVVTCATRSTEPLVEGDRVRPGTHVDLVGAFTPAMRESDAALLARARVFVDTREGALAEAGDLLRAIKEGAFTAGALAGDLSDLCAGRVPGRRRADEITVFKSVGTAVADLVAATLALERGRPGAPRHAGA